MIVITGWVVSTARTMLKKRNTDCLPVHTVAHKPSVCMTPSPHSQHFEWSFALLHLRWHKTTWLLWSCACWTSFWLKTMHWQRLRPNGRLSPHYVSMHPKEVTEYLVGVIKHGSLVLRAPLSELGANSPLTAPLLSGQVIQWSAHHSKLSSSLFQGK